MVGGLVLSEMSQLPSNGLPLTLVPTFTVSLMFRCNQVNVNLSKTLGYDQIPANPSYHLQLDCLVLKRNLRLKVATQACTTKCNTG